MVIIDTELLDGERQLGFLFVILVGLIEFQLPWLCQFIYLLYALPTLWQLRSKHNSNEDEGGA